MKSSMLAPVKRQVRPEKNDSKPMASTIDQSQQPNFTTTWWKIMGSYQRTTDRTREYCFEPNVTYPTVECHHLKSSNFNNWWWNMNTSLNERQIALI
jgi:hypothetical protein